jgi:hypothetical protein
MKCSSYPIIIKAMRAKLHAMSKGFANQLTEINKHQIVNPELDADTKAH